MRILVTGATGFLGGRVARRLQYDGHDVLGHGRDATAGACLEADGVRFVQGDLADAPSLVRASAGCDAIVHAGALAAPWGRPVDFLRTNVQGTAAVLAAAQRVRASRLVHISTSSCFFQHRSAESVNEEAPPALPFVNAYARTKWAAECLVDAAVAAGLDAVTMRPRAIYGPGDRALLPRLLRAHKGGRLLQIGDGTNRTDLTYVDNIVDAVVLALHTGAARARTQILHQQWAACGVMGFSAPTPAGAGLTRPPARGAQACRHGIGVGDGGMGAAEGLWGRAGAHPLHGERAFLHPDRRHHPCSARTGLYATDWQR
jgi:nucleoside-diphosphate-sugar epimerase